MATDTLLELRNCSVSYPVRVADGSVRRVHAVTDLTLSIQQGETLALVGESGCGKSSTARTAMLLQRPDKGQVLFEGRDVTALGARAVRKARRDFQLVYQDPYASLDPRMTVGESIAEPLRAHRVGSRADQRRRVADLLDLVGLPRSAANGRPQSFSGGQRQRIGIARALALSPKLLIADEPVSALDVSIQAQILNLLMDLKQELGIGMLFISHDLHVVEHVSDRIGVMYLGRLVELGDARRVFSQPAHPYTKALLDAIPRLDVVKRDLGRIEGEVPSPVDPPPGCPFHTRCPVADHECRSNMPQAVQVVAGHLAACHRIQTTRPKHDNNRRTRE